MAALEDVVAFLNELQDASPVPVLALSNWLHDKPQWGATPFPGEGSAMMLGATRDVGLAYGFGRLAAREAKAVGIDCVWIPCVDVNTNHRNPIISTRAFGDRPELVRDLACALVRGMQQELLLPNAKHFPGHGDTGFDTHVKIGVVPHARARLDAVELFPYRALIKDGLRGIMTAHIVFPALDDTPGLPATFSRRAIHGVLRDEMGYDGLIVSDSLTMKAIKDNFTVAEAAVNAFNAGHDVVLQDYDEPPMPTFAALLSAVQDGRIPLAELDASVMRILEAKEWAGMPGRPPVDIASAVASFRQPDSIELADELYARSVTVLEDGLHPAENSGKVCLIATISADEGQDVTDSAATVESSRDVFFRECTARLRSVTTHVLPEDPSPADVSAAVTAAEDCDTVLFATMPRVVCYKALSGAVGHGQVALIQELVTRGKGVFLGVFGAPYVISEFPPVRGCLTTYSPDVGAVRAGVRVLFGEAPAQGRLPIDLSPTYPFGFGK